MKHLFTLIMFALIGLSVYGQNTVKGYAVDGETGEPLIGANVLIEGERIGTVVGLDGSFELKNVPTGEQTLSISYLGYETYTSTVSVTKDVDLGDVAVASSMVGLNEVQIIANVAIDRKTPVAVSTISGDIIAEKLGNQEFPEILKKTPSVYTTKSGGGFGDARINVRGFDQSNTAVLINGIPVNDMENGWVYWSNWAGLSDVTRRKEVQRGLGASKLAISSVGGTINIVTKTTDQAAGGAVSVGVGNDNFLKYGLTLSTGEIGKGWAMTFSGTRTTGDGYVDAAYIDAWSYFGSITKELNEKHSLVFTAIGAPQKHGQRSFREKLSKYVPETEGADYEDMIKSATVSDYDNRLEADTDAYGTIKYSPIGNVRYNSDWGFRNGEVYNIRENFYNKPQFALNHYWSQSTNFSLSTSLYYSVGRGGGTGDRGSIGAFGGGTAGGTWAFRDDNGLIRVDDIFAWNSGTDNIDGFPENGHYQDATNGFVASEARDGNNNKGLIKRASMNEHNWLGVLSKATVNINENLTLIGGVDLRQYTGRHYRKAVDLMGNDAWLESRDVNGQDIVVNTDGNVDSLGMAIIDRRETGKLVTADEGLFGNPGQAQKLNYDNDGIVGWQGAFAELEFSKDALTAFVSGSLSNTSYTRVDRFNYLEGSENETSDTYNFIGYNAKLGANYNINRMHNVFINTGYYSRAPFFDTVFPNFNNVDVNENPANENVLGVELGYGLRTSIIAANVNAYWTNWKNKSFFVSAANAEGFANISGLDAIHQGIEFEFEVKPMKGLSFDAMAGLGDWQWANDVTAIIVDDNNVPIDTVAVMAKGLKVGDAAQTNIGLGASYVTDFGLGIDVDYIYFANLYAQFDPTDAAGEQALLLPSYGLLDAGISYSFNFNGVKPSLRFNVNNLLDELYIAEARNASTLQDAAGYFGFGRTWNATLRVKF